MIERAFSAAMVLIAVSFAGYIMTLDRLPLGLRLFCVLVLLWTAAEDARDALGWG